MAVPGTGPDPGLNESETPGGRWKRIEALFNAASELDGEARRAFLSNACGDDSALREELESLLESADKSLSVLHNPVRSMAQAVAVEAARPASRRIGAYELISLIGSGGMGEVYLGARVDGAFEQQVAVKLLRSDLEQTIGVSTRLQAERQILAGLDHPNIARLLDGGVTADGKPYLMMEYVAGSSIDAYCRNRNLTVGQRLLLFLKICSAIEYAHQRLVVHRDIKPANILVTREGVPKLLDFGIAKLVDPEQRSLEPTRLSQRLMTPEYASPEQLLGKAITAATDIYGLGVLLYELLSGVRPFRIEKGNVFEIAREICEKDPPVPSEIAAANKYLAPPDAWRIRGELESIVLKAMNKDAGLRYESVSRFSADVEAYLSGYPISTKAGNLGYRASKWIVKHKGQAAAIGLTVLVLIGSTVAMAILAHRANEARMTAQREARFLVDMFKAATPEVARGRTVTARDLLDQGVRRIDSELAGFPSVHASMLHNMAESYESLGLFDQAQDLARRAYDLRSQMVPNSSDTADSLFLYANLIRQRGEYGKAEPYFRQLVDLRRRTTGQQDVSYAGSLSALGECLYLEGKDRDAEPLLRQALAIDRRSGPNYGSDARNYLALLVERKGGYNEAASLLQEAVEIDDRTEGKDSPNYATSLHNLASALIDQGDLNGAEARLRETLAIRRKVLGNDNPALAYTLNNLGYVELEKGNLQAAEPLFREALNLNVQRLGAQHPAVAGNLNNRARLLQAKGDYAGAEKTYQQALDVLRAANAFTSWPASQILLNRGLLEFDQRHYAAAETWARQALEMKRTLGGENSPALDSALIDIAEDEVFRGDATSAEPLLRQALEIRKGNYSAKHPALIAAEVRLGEALIAEGKAPEAEPILSSAVEAADTAPFPLLRWQVAEAESALASCLEKLHRTDEAEALERRSAPDLLAHPRPPFRRPTSIRLNTIEWR